jgi:hypothetical protein
MSILSENKSEMNRLSSPQTDTHNDMLFYTWVGILHKLGLCESSDVYSTYKWLTGDE